MAFLESPGDSTLIGRISAGWETAVSGTTTSPSPLPSAESLMRAVVFGGVARLLDGATSEALME
jgi:hypothetical protein